jgi:hypothetical protein
MGDHRRDRQLRAGPVAAVRQHRLGEDSAVGPTLGIAIVIAERAGLVAIVEDHDGNHRPRRIGRFGPSHLHHHGLATPGRDQMGDDLTADRVGDLTEEPGSR